jgi:hypothetical protein
MTFTAACSAKYFWNSWSTKPSDLSCRAEHDRGFQQDGVDLAGVEGLEGVDGAVEDLGLGGRLDGVGDVAGPGGVELGAPLEVLGVGQAVHRGALLGQDALVGVEGGSVKSTTRSRSSVRVTWLRLMSQGTAGRRPGPRRASPRT